MKRKLIVAIPILLIMAIIVVILVLTREKKPDSETLIESSAYPVSFRQEGINLILTLDGSRTPELTWSVTDPGDGVVRVQQDGEEKKGKATYILSPGTVGTTTLEFSRSAEVKGYEYDAVRIRIPLYVMETETGKEVQFTDGEQIAVLSDVGGTDSENPFIVCTKDEGDPEIIFPDGQGCWVLADPDSKVSLMSMVGTGKTRKIQVSEIQVTDRESELGVEFIDGSEGYKPNLEPDDPNEEIIQVIIDPVTGDTEIQKLDPAASETQTAQQAEENYLDQQQAKYRGMVQDPGGGTKKACLLVINEELQKTEFIDVTIDADGKVSLCMGTDPAEKAEK